MIKISDLEFIKIIGTGAFGRVYLGRLKTGTKANFAVKILEKRRILKQRLADQLENEINIQRKLYGSPFVAKLFSTDYHNGMIAIILEHVCGGELFYWLKKFGRFSEHATIFYTCEVISALKYIHDRGILYRDLKPENILITLSGHIKLIDFGFAVHDNEKTYVVSGTPEYMAPEKLMGEGDGKESDYWGLGVIIYEMLCGDPPFYDQSTDIIYRKILETQAIFPSHMNPIAIDLIAGLLDKNRCTRLGYGGISEIKRHPYFKNVNWFDIENGKIRPPFVPKNKKSFEDRNTSLLKIEEIENYNDNVIKPYKNIKNFSCRCSRMKKNY